MIYCSVVSADKDVSEKRKNASEQSMKSMIAKWARCFQIQLR